MNGYHDSCIRYHQEMTDAAKKRATSLLESVMSLKKACRKEVSIMPEYYEVLRDTSHKDVLPVTRNRQRRQKMPVTFIGRASM